jgi:hypothetical protein
MFRGDPGHPTLFPFFKNLGLRNVLGCIGTIRWPTFRDQYPLVQGTQRNI